MWVRKWWCWDVARLVWGVMRRGQEAVTCHGDVTLWRYTECYPGHRDGTWTLWNERRSSSEQCHHHNKHHTLTPWNLGRDALLSSYDLVISAGSFKHHLLHDIQYAAQLLTTHVTSLVFLSLCWSLCWAWVWWGGRCHSSHPAPQLGMQDTESNVCQYSPIFAHLTIGDSVIQCDYQQMSTTILRAIRIVYPVTKYWKKFVDIQNQV